MLELILKPGVFKHVCCINGKYAGTSTVVRQILLPDQILWCAPFDNYNPPSYTAKHILDGQVWADADLRDVNFTAKWNAIDGHVNRVSYNGVYYVDNNNCPRNPMGRTGLRGRGLLGRWGPNHAADAIVTRWKRQPLGTIETIDNRPILQMVAIQRRDNSMWAIPGGMLDAGEQPRTALKREFMEEALDDGIGHEQVLNAIFAAGIEIYKGYVDDHRNTDNAWMETVACNFHDDSGQLVQLLALKAGDDAQNVRWLDIDRQMSLHGNHAVMVAQVAHHLKAHW